MKNFTKLKVGKIISLVLALVLTLTTVVNMNLAETKAANYNGENRWDKTTYYSHMSIAVNSEDGHSLSGKPTVTAVDGSKSYSVPLGNVQSSQLNGKEYQSSMNYSFTTNTKFVVTAKFTDNQSATFTITDKANYKNSGYSFYQYCAKYYCDGHNGIDMKLTYSELIENFYKVIYSVDGNTTSIIDGKNYKEGETVTVTSEIPEKEGYVFAGWTIEGNTDNTLYNAGNTVTMKKSQIVFVADFEESYKVKYDLNGGSSDTEISDNGVYLKGSTATVVSAEPVKTGYVFDGWSDGNTVYTAGNEIVIEKNVTLTAQWKKLYTVTYKVDGTVVYDNDKVADGDSYTPNYEYTPAEGYDFSGWDVKDTIKNVKEDLTISGTTSKKTFTITYFVDNTKFAEDTVKYGDSYKVDKTYTNPAKIFSGWSVTGTINNITENIIITGTTTDKTFNAIYVVDGNTVNTVTGILYGTKYTDNYVYTPAEGYTFSGFTCEGNASYVTDTLVYTGKTEKIRFTVTFKDENGNVIGNAQKVDYKEAANIETAPAKADSKIEGADIDASWIQYSFDKWVAAGEYTIDDLESVTQDMTFTASYKSNEVIVKYYVLNKGLSQPSELYHYPRTNYSNGVVGTLHYYNEQANDDAKVAELLAKTPTTEELKNVGIVLEEGQYVKWYVIKKESDNWHVDGIIVNQMYDLTINYVDANGNKVADSYETKTAATKDYSVASPEITGYTIADENNSIIKGTMPYGNVTVSVEYTRNEYNVIFNDYNGKQISTGKYFYGEKIVVPENPEREADEKYIYKFKGWDKEVSEVCTANATYTAEYESADRLYSVTFVDVEGSTTKQYTFEADIEVPNAAEKKTDEYSYDFNSWKPQGDYELTSKVTENMIFVAEYDTLYSVTFISEDDSNTTYYKNEDSIVVPENPTKDSTKQYTYEFESWTKDDVPFTEEEIENLSIDDNMTFIAEFDSIVNQYTVTYVVDGTTYNSYKVDYGTALDTDSEEYVPAEGYDFSGWTIDPSSELTDGKVTGDVIVTGTTSKTPEVEPDEDVKPAKDPEVEADEDVKPAKDPEVEADEDVKPAKNPEVEADTEASDRTNVTIYLAFAALAALAAFATLSFKGNKKEEDAE